MAACTIFDEDEVCMPLPNGGFKYGLVVESSEYISSDEEDEEMEDRVQRGTVKVAWHPNGNETVVPENKLILADRSLMPGDVVRRLISGTDSQRGFVQNMNVKCHVRILGTEQYIYNIDVQSVKPIQEWDPEPDVTLDSWVGHVMEVNEQLVLKFPDGARCKLSNASLLNLEDANDNRETHSEFHMRNFYPGQQLRGCMDDYEDATWIHSSQLRGPKKMEKESLYSVPVLVEKVETNSVEVRWICKGFTKTGADLDKLVTPNAVVDRENLKRLRRLDCFDFCHRQIGDKGYYVIKDTDVLVPNLSPRRHATPDVLDKVGKENSVVLGTHANGLIILRQGSKDSDVSGKAESEIASGEETTVYVNGDIDLKGDVEELGLGVDENYESDNLSDESDASSSHSIPTGQKKSARKSAVSMRRRKKYKGRKAKKKHKKQQVEVQPGDNVAVEIFYTFSQCDVMWQDGSVERDVPSPELFPIHHLDELEFFPGDFVLDSKANTSTEYGVVISCDHKERTVMVRWMKPYLGKNGRPEEKEPVELSVYDIKDHPDYKFRSGHTVIRIGGFEENKELEAVGQVYKLDQSGVIHVWWPDGTVTQNFPQDLYIISDEFNSEDGSSDDWTDFDEEEEEEEEDSDSDVSWETEEEVETEGEEETKKKPLKPSWVISDSKKKELDELLQRLQGAISGLLKVFMEVPGPFFKSSKQVFQDILSIFKRCKELEKILKSQFLDDEELLNLIRDVRDKLRSEKTTKLVKHVTSLYRSQIANEPIEYVVKEKTREESHDCVQNISKADVQQDSSQQKCDSAKGAEALASTVQSGQVLEVESLRKALIDYGTNITDPLLQIIFDTSLHLSVAKGASNKVSDENMTVGDTNERNTDSMCQSNDEALSFDCAGHLSNQTQEHCNKGDGVLKVSKDTQQSLCTENDVNADQASVQTFIDGVSVDKGKHNDESNCLPDVVQGATGEEENAIKSDSNDQYDAETNLTPDHRDLCIRVCTVINAKLLYIHQEITKRWLAQKFGCDENTSDIEVFTKAQEKMSESIESENGALKYFPDQDEIDDLKVLMVENVKELESLTETRTLESESSREPSLDKKEDSMTEKIEKIETQDSSEVATQVNEHGKGFILCEETPANHRFKYHTQKPANLKAFHSAVNKELMLIQNSLPDGIIVKAFEDRLDLFSALIKGPANTPYEDGLFVFDIQLPANYPSSPPVFHYLSFCSERLNPNLYEDGKVCVSLLGTWTGKGNEVWTCKSNLLQVLVSIQGLILVNEPYFNEAGYEKQRNTQHGQENSRMYNEMAILKLIQSMTQMAVNPPAMFVAETEEHLQKTALRMIGRVEHWIQLSQRDRHSKERSDLCSSTENHSNAATPQLSEGILNETEVYSRPDFPLLPASKGFCLTVTKYLDIYKNILSEHILRKPHHNS